ncbi:glycosyltransferase family 4 protein [Rhizobium sp. Root482]|uniref:glycosyltransferase family 4 protein n=1 Tax=Rhizobium sp. Root482 TaxID=1736543 RepID=UPI0006FC72D9|nr:glycosyltransferase family 4 protein [Rhizobium sp. Root482]KQY26661.1 hypothetical protein ASD31_00145 [Rhizobium sp. Root482]
MKFAFFVMPHIGGTYSVFTQLRQGMAPHGISVEWLGLEKRRDFAGIDEEEHAAYGAYVSCPPEADEQQQAAALARAIRLRGYDGIFVNVLADPVETNLVRYLPSSVLRIMIVHNITYGTYLAATAIRNHVHATVCVSERCRRDLVRAHGFPPSSTFVIPNAVDVAAIGDTTRPLEPVGLRLIALGRVENISKGVFWLPEILRALPDDVTLTVAGDGPDLAELRRRLSGLEARVRFLGFVPPRDVLPLLLNHDALIMPSRFEGFGITIVEAMAAGCVPVVSRISGVTDTIVDHGKDGLLFKIGNGSQAVSIILALRNRSLWAALSIAARQKARDAFSVDLMGTRYAALVRQVDDRRPRTAAPLDIAFWSMPGSLRPSFRRLVPQPIKNWLRLCSERL